MAAKTTAKKTTARKSTAKTTAPKTEATEEPISLGDKSCAYPGCSARASEEAGGDKKVPSCSAHASIFNDQHNDGAGIEQLIAGYKG